MEKAGFMQIACRKVFVAHADERMKDGKCEIKNAKTTSFDV
jgi:hypothetical protein